MYEKYDLHLDIKSTIFNDKKIVNGTVSFAINRKAAVIRPHSVIYYKEERHMWGIIISIIIGAVCGWLASIIMKSKSGLLWYIIMGIVGGFLGSFIFGLLGIGSNNIIGQIIIGVIGTCLLIFGYRFITGKKK